MKIDVAGESSVLVAVSAAELAAFALTFETMDYANAQTRRLVTALLREIDRQTGRQLSADAPLQIDALPDPDGGCLFVFTQRSSAGDDARIFFAADIAPFIDAARAAAQLPATGDCALFQDTRGLFLLTTACSAGLLRLLSEFLTTLPPSPLQAVRLEERSRCLIAAHALEILRGA